MALRHAQPLDIIDLHAGPAQRGTAASSSLLKTHHLQLMRLELPAGHQLPQHHVAGEVVIQCVRGEASVVTPQQARRLSTGQLVVLAGGTPHAVDAHSDATLLVTVLRGS